MIQKKRYFLIFLELDEEKLVAEYTTVNKFITKKGILFYAEQLCESRGKVNCKTSITNIIELSRKDFMEWFK